MADAIQNSKVVFIVCDQGVEPDVMEILAAQGHAHYTSWTGCSGAGETGVRQGTPVWPGLNTIVMVVMDTLAVSPLVAGLHEMRDSFPITPGLKVIVTDGLMI